MATASAYAPGRVELLGNHTDYNQGVVLAAAIDRGLTITGAARRDDLVVLNSETRVEIALANLQPQAQERWANYPLGVVHELRRGGHVISGFEASISGDLPSGIGLSSSAALEVATAGFLMKLNGLQIAPLEIAKLCHRAENEFVGVRSGLLDQVTSIFGRKDQLVFLDCRTEEVRTIPFPAGFALVIADSGTKHSHAQSQYNARREECAAAAKALSVPSLREIAASQLIAARAALDPLLYRRAAHVVGENDRVWRAVDALRIPNAAMIGELMNASHESSRMNFENSTPELNLMVSIAQSLPGVLGSRLTGGGFGGATVSLVETAHADEVVSEVRLAYAKHSGRTPNVFVCRIADGAAVSWPTLIAE